MALPTCINGIKLYKEFHDVKSSYEWFAVFGPLFIFVHHFARYVLLEPSSVVLHCRQTTDIFPL